MTITKLGHCCLLIEVDGKRILTDPGLFTIEQQEAVDHLDAILITHEHADHLHVESLTKVLAKNPKARLITNASVAMIIQPRGLDVEVVQDGQTTNVDGVAIEGFGNEHAEIYRDYKLVQNTGYMIHGRLFYPGDAFTDPSRPVEILALPVAGPWMKVKEAIDYALEIQPRLAFPVHDGILSSFGSAHTAPEEYLGNAGIRFIVPNLGTAFEVEP